MESSQKTRLILVVCANVLLSATVALAIWTNADKAKDSSSVVADSTVGSEITKSENTAEAGSATKVASAQTVEADVRYPASKRNEVQKLARKDAGSDEPMKSIKTASSCVVRAMDDSGLTSDVFVSKKKPTGKMVSYPGFVPPPPPDPVAAAPVQRSHQVAQFDAVSHTPERKFGIKVTGIIGNRAMLLMRKEGMSRNEKPEVVCLAPGEQVRNINNLPVSVLVVDKDSVTLEVNGDRFVKTLPEIR